MGRTLSEHAAYELTKAGLVNNEDPKAQKSAQDILGLVRRFEKQGHKDEDAEFILNVVTTLCQRLPLTPITDDPDEWEKFEVGKKNIDTGEEEKKIVWQSLRFPALFSEDKGKTYRNQGNGEVGESIDHIKDAEERRQKAEDRAKRKAEAEARANTPNPIGTVNPDVPAGEVSAVAPDQESTPAEDTAGKAAEAEAVAKQQGAKPHKKIKKSTK